MIKLSDVKVRPQYRTRVRYRLLVLEYAWEHGPAAAGRLRTQRSDDSPVAEALAAGRRRGTGTVLSSAPGAAGATGGHRADSPSPPGVRLRGGAHTALAPARARDPAGHGHDSAGVSRHGSTPPAADPQAGTPPDDRRRFPDFEAAAAALRGWETRYNYERFSLALQGRTPAEKLAALHPPRRAA